MVSNKKEPEAIKISGSVGLLLGSPSNLRALMPNCGLLRNDFIYFLDKAKAQGENEISNSYARAAIIFMVFYLEGLINLLLDDIYKKMKAPKRLIENYQNNWKIDPPQKFEDVYSFIYDDELPTTCNIVGMRDIFKVRNKVIAHPRSYGITSGPNIPVGKGLTIDEKEINYGKLRLPNTLDHFKTEHAQIIYDEIKQFLANYYNLVKSSFPEYLSYYFNLP